MKKIDKIIQLLESINNKIDNNLPKKLYQDNNVYLLISETEIQNDVSKFSRNFNIIKKIEGKSAFRLNKFIELILNRYKYEIDFLSFSVIDFEEFHNSRIFNICNLLLKNPNISEWIRDNLAKNHKQNDLLKFDSEIQEMDIKYLQILQNIFYNLKRSGLLKGNFLIENREGKIRVNIEAYVNNFFLTTGWYELAYISKMSNLNNAVLVNNIKYKKGTSVAEIDLMVIRDDEISIFELKNSKQIQSLYSGLEQLEYHQKIFSIESSKCFLVINDDFPIDERFQAFLDEIKSKGFNLVKVSELGNISI